MRTYHLIGTADSRTHPNEKRMTEFYRASSGSTVYALSYGVVRASGDASRVGTIQPSMIPVCPSFRQLRDVIRRELREHVGTPKTVKL